MKHKACQTEQLASFARAKTFEELPADIVDQLKKHLLDSIGSMYYSLGHPTPKKLFNQIDALGEGGRYLSPGNRRLAIDRCAQLFTACIRFPDFMDNYMGKESTCHPSDNIGSLLAAAQYHPCTGKDFLHSMAIAYEVECRLIEEIPVMMEGIDHTLLLSFSIIAGLAQLLQLSEQQTAHALAIAGCSISPLAVSRASYTYEWKGLASCFDALNCLNMAFLARENVTGPLALFEGPKGFKQVFDMTLDFDWSTDRFELIRKCVLKKFNAEVHSQATLEALLELKEKHQLTPDLIKSVHIDTFLTAYHIIGGGEYGDRKTVHSKEQADHSLFYLAAVTLIDGEVYPEQLLPERIAQDDVQKLLQKVTVATKFPLHKPVKIAGALDPYTAAYPDDLKTEISITLESGETISSRSENYPGFYKTPFSWEQTIKKFKRLSGAFIDEATQDTIIGYIQQLETIDMKTPISLITQV